MRRALAVVVVIAALAGTAGSQATGPLPVITVFEFSGSGIPHPELVVFADYLVSHVVQLGGYRVIDRSQRKNLLEEVEFSQSDCSDETCQIEIGRMLSASQVVVGSVGQFGNRYILNAKLVDVESSKLINSVSRNYTRIEELLQDSGDVVQQLLRPGVEGGAIATVAPDQSTPVTDSGPAAPKPAGSRGAGTYPVGANRIDIDGDPDTTGRRFPWPTATRRATARAQWI